MNGRPPQRSPHRLLAGLVLPLGAYLLIRAAIGSGSSPKFKPGWQTPTGVKR